MSAQVSLIIEMNIVQNYTIKDNQQEAQISAEKARI